MSMWFQESTEGYWKANASCTSLYVTGSVTEGRTSDTIQWKFRDPECWRLWPLLLRPAKLPGSIDLVDEQVVLQEIEAMGWHTHLGPPRQACLAVRPMVNNFRMSMILPNQMTTKQCAHKERKTSMWHRRRQIAKKNCVYYRYHLH